MMLTGKEDPELGEWMISACVVPTVKHGGGGCVMVWACFAGDTVCDLSRIQGKLNQHGTTICFVFQQDNDATPPGCVRAL